MKKSSYDADDLDQCALSFLHLQQRLILTIQSIGGVLGLGWYSPKKNVALIKPQAGNFVKSIFFIVSSKAQSRLFWLRWSKITYR
jgi:hypothetical protein